MWTARAERAGLLPGDLAATRLAAFTVARGDEVGPFAPELVPRIMAARASGARDVPRTSLRSRTLLAPRSSDPCRRLQRAPTCV
jgi:hypothetical protein